MKIYLDAGHGGKDSGAVGQRGTREKDFTLDIAKRCAVYAVRIGHNAILTRNADVFLELAERANIANRASADLFISIHCNSADTIQANGIETFYYTGSSKGKEYATKVQSKLVKVTGLRDRGVKEANFAVLRHTKMPGILIECGFISNNEEELLLMSEEYRDKVAKCIVESIIGQSINTEDNPKASKYTVNYCLEFQKFYNQVTKTKAPLLEDGIYGSNTERALQTITKIIREF